MKFHAQIGDHTLTFASQHAKVKLFEHKGKNVIIEIDDKPNSKMRRFFEGAVVPYVFYQNQTAGWEDFRDAREALKVEFLPSYSKSIRGDRIRLSQSTTTLSKGKFSKFLETVTRWMEENGYEVPDYIDYNKWKNSAPMAGSIYPPLKRLIETHSQKK